MGIYNHLILNVLYNGYDVEATFGRLHRNPYKDDDVYVGGWNTSPTARWVPGHVCATAWAW